MPAAVNKTARITNPANQLMITMTAISPLLMLRFPLPAIIIFRYPGKSISGIPGSQSWPKNSPTEAPDEHGPRAAGRSDGGLTLTYLREKVDRGLSPLSTTRYLFARYLLVRHLLARYLFARHLFACHLLARYLFARHLFDPAFDPVGHSSPVFPKWNPQLSSSWVHKPHLTVLEPMDFEAYNPGWVPQ